MMTTDEEIETLTGQLRELNVSIAVLASKHDAATATARRFAFDLENLRAQHVSLARQLRELETSKNGMSMWENIGDGG